MIITSWNGIKLHWKIVENVCGAKVPIFRYKETMWECIYNIKIRKSLLEIWGCIWVKFIKVQNRIELILRCSSLFQRFSFPSVTMNMCQMEKHGTSNYIQKSMRPSMQQKNVLSNYQFGHKCSNDMRFISNLLSEATVLSPSYIKKLWENRIFKD